MLIQEQTIDEKQTLTNVKASFTKELPIIKAQAHVSFISLKSPILDAMPRGGSNENNVEAKLTNHLQAKQWPSEIVEVIKCLPEKPRMFLDYRYLQNMQWLEIKRCSGYSSRRGAQLVNQGLMMFVDVFIDIYDFRVFTETK